MKFLQTAPPSGWVHLIPADGDGVTLCGKVASTDLGTGKRVVWPRWYPSDRGRDPIHRASCPTCVEKAR